uniref:DUF4334 domain-containing protein n=1 Tax=Arthrobacter sp. G119Y2 TaxID=3134965 RepID=UPI00311989D0
MSQQHPDQQTQHPLQTPHSERHNPEQQTSEQRTPKKTPAERLSTLSRGTTAAEALAFFDSLPPVRLDEVIGDWHGADVPTGHRLDGALGPLGWQGKRFEGAEAARPLIFRTAAGKEFEVNPGLVPLRLALRIGPLVHKHPGAGRAARPLLQLTRTGRPRARLRMMEYRGVVSATMIYDALPVNDAFRKVDANTLLGAMDMRRPAAPFMFSLHRTL